MIYNFLIIPKFLIRIHIYIFAIRNLILRITVDTIKGPFRQTFDIWIAVYFQMTVDQLLYLSEKIIIFRYGVNDTFVCSGTITCSSESAFLTVFLEIVTTQHPLWA